MRRTSTTGTDAPYSAPMWAIHAATGGEKPWPPAKPLGRSRQCGQDTRPVGETLRGSARVAMMEAADHGRGREIGSRSTMTDRSRTPKARAWGTSPRRSPVGTAWSMSPSSPSRCRTGLGGRNGARHRGRRPAALTTADPATRSPNAPRAVRKVGLEPTTGTGFVEYPRRTRTVTGYQEGSRHAHSTCSLLLPAARVPGVRVRSRRLSGPRSRPFDHQVSRGFLTIPAVKPRWLFIVHAAQTPRGLASLPRRRRPVIDEIEKNRSKSLWRLMRPFSLRERVRNPRRNAGGRTVPSGCGDEFFQPWVAEKWRERDAKGD